MFRLTHPLQDEAGAADLTGAGGDAGAGDGAASTTTTTTADEGAARPVGALAAAAAAAAAGGAGAGEGDGAAPAARPEWCPETNWNAEAGRPVVPEKFWDKDTQAPKVIDLARAHSELEKRFGNAAELPPKAPTDYKFEPADGEDLTVDPALEKPFQEFAHKIGLNNGQYNEILREYAAGYNASAKRGVEQYIDRQVTETNAALLAEFGSKEAVAKVHGDAYLGYQKFATPEEMAQINELPDHPAIIKILARVGAMTKEDTPPNTNGGDGFESLTMKADAIYKDLKGPYWNDKHPEHAQAMATHRAYMAECARRKVDPLQHRLAKSA